MKKVNDQGEDIPFNEVYNKVLTVNIPQFVEETKDNKGNKKSTNPTLDNNSLHLKHLPPFDLIFFCYYGKITSIADYFNFNKLSIEKCIEIVNRSEDYVTKQSCLHVSVFLSFKNIFMYMLTFNANLFHLDINNRNFLHFIAYKGEVKCLLILINWLRFNHRFESLEKIDPIPSIHGFGKMDIVKGKLSRGIFKTETNINSFKSIQLKVKQEASNLVHKNLDILEKLLSQKDCEGRNVLHYAAMSKYSLCYQVLFEIVDYEFFKLNGWEEFLEIFNDTQDLEIKPERLVDPRKCLRVEKVLENLLGDYIIKQLKAEFNSRKSNMLKALINQQDNNGDTVLHVAAFHGDFRIVSKLLFAGGNKNINNLQGKLPVDLAKDDFVRKVLTSLNKAAKNSDNKSIVELVNFGHNINDKSSIFSQAPIHKIIESKKSDKYEVLKNLILMGADPNTKDSNGWTPLHYACQSGDLEAVKILVESNSKLDSYSNNKRTPLHFACSGNFPEIVEYLLNSSADPNFKDSLGCTPLHLSAKYGHVKCLSLLLLYNSKLYCEDFRQWNILHYASFNGHKETVRFINKYDVDQCHLFNCLNSQNKLPIEIVKTPEVKPYFSNIWQSSKEGNLDMIRQVLNEGEDINEQTTFLKNSALHLAVFNNHFLAVRLLVDMGIDVNLKNVDGLTAAEYSDIINRNVNNYYTPDKDNNYVDFRDFVRNVFNKPEKILKSTVIESSTKIRVWNMQDFSNKIAKLLNKSN